MKKIIILKIGAIGDVIMALPVITEIKVKYPNAHITWICGKTVKPILLTIPFIDEIISIDENNLFLSNKLIAIRELVELQTKIAFKKYDLILNFHSDYRYKLITFLLRSPINLHLSRKGDRPTLIPGRSRAFEHLRLFLQSDGNFTGSINFPLDTINKNELKPEIEEILNDGKIYVLIAPGGAKNALSEQSLRRWPIEHYVRLSEYLLKHNFAVILTGGPTDDWVKEHFLHLEVINLVGQLTLINLIALMRRVQFVVTHDSGPFHLAIFANNPYVVGLFGPTNPSELLYGKSYEKVKILWGGADLLCSPCYYGKYYSKQCNNNICMHRIAVESVIEIISRVGVE